MISVALFLYVALLSLIVIRVIPAIIVLGVLYYENKKLKSKMINIMSISFIITSAITVLSYMNTDFSGDPPSFSNTYFLFLGFLSLISLISLIIGIITENKKIKKQK